MLGRNKCACIHDSCIFVTVYWASPLILSFQVLTILLMTIVWMMRTDMIIWGTVSTMRSVPMSIASRCGHHPVLLYFERLCEDLSIYCLWKILYTLLSVCNTLHEILFGRLHAQAHIFCWYHRLLFYVESYLLAEAVFWKWYQMCLLSAAIKCLRKLIIEFSVIKNE